MVRGMMGEDGFERRPKAKVRTLPCVKKIKYWVMGWADDGSWFTRSTVEFMRIWAFGNIRYSTTMT